MYRQAKLLIASATCLITGCTGSFQSSSTLSSVKENSPAGLILTSGAVMVTAPPANSPTQGNITLKGSCVTGLDVEISGDIATPKTVDCVDGGFSTSISLNTPDGLKNVRASQRDQRNKVAASSQSFQLDTTPPTLSLVTPTAGADVSAKVVVQGLCETNLPLAIEFEGQKGSLPCANGMFATTLTLAGNDGISPISLEQRDPAGNIKTIRFDVRKDTIAPTISITSPDANATVGSMATIAGACEAGLNVEIAGTGVDAPVTVPCTSGNYSGLVVFTNGGGSKQVTSTQKDKAGNAGSSSRSLTVSTVGPAVEITAPAANTLFKTTLNVSGTCVTGLPVVFSGAGWAGPANATCTNGMFSAAVSFTAGDGSKNIIASQTNAQNQTGASSRAFIRDSTAPTITIASPAGETAAKTGVMLTGTCESGLQVKINGSGVASETNVACLNGAYSSQINFSNGDGAKAVTVSQTDAAGNSASASRTFVRDTSAPLLTITSPAQGTMGATGLMVSGTCEGTINVVASGSGLSASVSKACANSTFSLDIVFSNGDGDKLVNFSQTDAAGNIGTVARTFRRGTASEPLDGALLYSQNCASCHNPLATSTKKNKSVAEITAATKSIPQMAAFQTSLSAAQISAIATALAGATVPNQCQVTDPGRETIHRLNKEEYNNTVRDLLGIAIRPADAFPDDAFGETFNNNADALTLNSSLLDMYISAAKQSVDEYFRVNKAKYVTCTATTTACATQILTPFTEKAFRRPVTSTEVTRLTNFVSVATGQGETFEAGIKLAMQAVLSSPDFLYRSIKHSAPNSATSVVELDEYELASRLSYFIWSSMPDDALFLQAKNKTLKANLSAQVTRMMADAKAQALIDNFATQWLSLHRLKNVQPNKTMFPQFDETLRSNMLTETKMLLKEIFTKNLSAHELVKANYTFVNGALASHYGFQGVSGTAFQKVNLTNRQGILSHASVSLLTSHSDYPSIIFRGKFVVMNLLCDPPPPPPAVIPPLPGSSELEKSASRLSDSRCMGCHTRMDPIGYGLQGFDALGRFRTKDENGVTIDGRGTMPTGEMFTGPIELSNVVAADQRLNACVSKRLMAYALARDLRPADDCAVAKATQAVGPNKGIAEVIQAIVSSEPFRKQRGDGGPQ